MGNSISGGDKMKDENGTALLLETAIILPMVLFMILIMYFSALYVIQKNNVFANSYHYSKLAAKIVTKPQLANNHITLAQDYIKLAYNIQPYTFITRQNIPFESVKQQITQDIKQHNILQLDQPIVTIKQKNNGLFIPKITLHVSYQTPIFQLLYYVDSLFKGENTIQDGFVSIAPIIDNAQFINHVQLGNEWLKKFNGVQNNKSLMAAWHKINYFLNKIK